MHRIIEQMEEKEVQDLLEFAVILGIIYPLLPPNPIEVLGITIPLQTVWFLIVIISLINFFSFLGSRYLEATYEVSLISFLGGLISSSGTTASLATQFKQNKDLKRTIAAGFLLTTAALIIKNLGIASIFNPSSAGYLLPVLLAGIIPLIPIAIYKASKSNGEGKMEIESPFHIKKAAKFGLAVLIFIAVVKVVEGIAPELVIITAFIAGTITSTSMTLSLVSLSIQGAIATNTFLLGVTMATLGSYVGDYILLIIGDAGEIVKSTWIEVTASMVLIVSALILTIAYL